MILIPTKMIKYKKIYLILINTRILKPHFLLGSLMCRFIFWHILIRSIFSWLISIAIIQKTCVIIIHRTVNQMNVDTTLGFTMHATHLFHTILLPSIFPTVDIKLFMFWRKMAFLMFPWTIWCKPEWFIFFWPKISIILASYLKMMHCI